MSYRPTICVDFDGVIHSYTSPWRNAWTIPDPPVEGAVEWLHQMLQHYRVVIQSSRTKKLRGRWAIRAWLRRRAGNLWHGAPGYRGLEEVELSATKPAALLYIDDRAYRFTGGNWPTKNEVDGLRPWNWGGKLGGGGSS